MLRAPASALDLETALQHFSEHGYARLGTWADDVTLAGLRERLDDLMLGRVPHEGYFFQHDSPTGAYEDLQYGRGWVGPSPDYRKVEKLEQDPRFWAWTTNALFERVTRALIPGGISLYRALVFAKSAAGGTELPWHQDGGVFWGVDREPFLQIWTALDDVPVAAGCLEVLPGTHKGGLTTKDGGVVPEDKVEAMLRERTVVQLPAVAGEVILIHNHLWHRSSRNHTQRPRRAFTACLMTSETRCLRKKREPRQFVRVFS